MFPHVRLADCFDDAFFDLEVRKGLCAPANKNSEGLLDGATHYRKYFFRPSANQPTFAKKLNVLVTNQLGSIHVDAVRRYVLMVPTAKDLVSTPAPPSPSSINYEHFKCYKVRVTTGTPKFVPTTVTISDQFISPAINFSVVKPKLLCVPTDKNGEGIVNQDRALLCYKAKSASPVTTPASAFTNNQFGPETVHMGKDEQLCIPSVVPSCQ